MADHAHLDDDEKTILVDAQLFFRELASLPPDTPYGVSRNPRFCPVQRFITPCLREVTRDPTLEVQVLGDDIELNGEEYTASWWVNSFVEALDQTFIPANHDCFQVDTDGQIPVTAGDALAILRQIVGDLG